MEKLRVHGRHSDGKARIPLLLTLVRGAGALEVVVSPACVFCSRPCACLDLFTAVIYVSSDGIVFFYCGMFPQRNRANFKLQQPML